MKKYLPLFTLLFISKLIFAQLILPKVYFNSSFADPDIKSEHIIQLTDSSFVLSGKSDSYNEFILQLNSNAEILRKYYIADSSSNQFEIKNICAGIDSSFIIGGNATDKFLTNLSTIFLLSVDKKSNSLWSKKIVLSSFEKPTLVDIQSTNDSSFIILVNDNIELNQYNDIVVLKIKNDGTILWKRKISTIDGSRLNAYKISIQTDTSFFILSNMDNTATIVNMTTSDSIIWCKSIPNIEVYDIIETDSILILSSSINSRSKLGILVLNKNGIFLSSKSYYPSFTGINRSKIINNKDQYVISNITTFGNTNDNAIYTLDSNFTLITSFISLNLVDILKTNNNSILLLNNGPYSGLKTSTILNAHSSISILDTSITPYMCAQQMFYKIDTSNHIFNGFNKTLNIDTIGSEYNFIFIKHNFKLDFDNGCITYIGSINEKNKYTLISIYPNPSSGIFKLINDGENIKDANLVIYDQLGKEQLSYKLDINDNNIIDASNLSNGIYYYSIFLKNNLLKQDKFVVIK